MAGAPPVVVLIQHTVQIKRTAVLVLADLVQGDGSWLVMRLAVPVAGSIRPQSS